MKTLKAICTATIFALALSVTAYAGDISSPGAPCPGDQQTPDITAPATDDLNTAGDVTTLSDTADSSGIVDILLGLVSIF